VRAIYSAAHVIGVRDGAFALGVPNEAHRSKCAQYFPEVEAAVVRVIGSKVPFSFIVEVGPAHDDDRSPNPSGASSRPSASSSTDSSSGAAAARSAVDAAADAADADIDLSELVDAPPESVVSPIDRLAQAFPGSELLDERR
jgi:DNA polymerase-3 subunit gamma/tau